MKDVNPLPKLVIATDNFPPRRDGIARFLTMMIPALKDHFQLTIICPDFEANNTDIEGATYVRIPLTKRYVGDFKSAKFRPKAITKAISNADIVFSQTLGAIGAVSLFTAQKMRKKTVCYIHSVEWQLVSAAIGNFFLKKYAMSIVKMMSRHLYSNANHLILPSQRIADLLSWERIFTPKTIINLGVDTESFCSIYDLPNRLTMRGMLGIKDDDIVIGYHGRIASEKDIPTLIRSYVKLRKRHKNLKILLVGSGIPELVKSFKKQPGIIHIPSTNNVIDYLSVMDIYCLPSLTETTSLSTLEAMSCSLPVVSTGVGFIKDYITNEVNGLFFPKSDSYALTRQIERLILDPALRKRLGEMARMTVSHRFHWELTSKKMVSFLKDFSIENCKNNSK